MRVDVAYLRLILKSKVYRCIMGITLLIIAIIWIFTLERLQEEKKIEVNSIMQANANLTEAFVENLQRNLENIDEILLFLKSEYEKNGKVTEGMVERIQLAKSIPAINITVDDWQGEIKMSLLPNPGKINVRERDYFQVHMGLDRNQRYISKPAICQIIGSEAFFISRRMNHADGSFGGVVVCGIEPQYFSAYYKKMKLGPGYGITVVGEDGQVRMRESNGKIDLGQDVSASPNFQRAMQSDSGAYVGTSVIDNTSRIFNYKHVDGYPLIVILSVEEKGAMAEYNKRACRYYITAIVCTVITISIFFTLIYLIRKQEQSKNKRRLVEARFSSAFNHAPIGMALVSPSGHWIKVNEMLCYLLGYSEKELLMGKIDEVTHPEDLEKNQELNRQLLLGKIATYRIEKRYRHKSGRVINGQLTVSVIKEDEGERAILIVQLEDITERKWSEWRVEQDDRRLRRILYISQLKTKTTTALLDAVLLEVVEITDSQFGCICFYDEECQSMTMYGCLPEVGENHEFEKKSGLWGEAIRQRKTIIMNEILDREKLNIGFPKHYEPLVRLLVTPIFIDGKIVAVIGIANKMTEYTELDISQVALLMDSLWNIIERKQAENALQIANEGLERKVYERTVELQKKNKELEDMNEKLQKLTMIDGLTGIANRRYFDDFLQRHWNIMENKEKQIGLIMADVDFFKQYNDTYGHLNGDHCLMIIASALKVALMETNYLVARYGGEEFVVVLPDTDLACARFVAKGLRACIEEMAIENRHTPLGIATISLGVAVLSPGQGMESASLLALADKALYKAKEAGRNCVAYL